MSELSIHELEAQHSEVLPEREALGRIVAIGSFGHNHVFAFNQANAFASGHGQAFADATQTVITG